MVELTKEEIGELSEEILLLLFYKKGLFTISHDATREFGNVQKETGIPEEKYRAFIKYIGTKLLDKMCTAKEKKA